jgi:hypothetical protein
MDAPTNNDGKCCGSASRGAGRQKRPEAPPVLFYYWASLGTVSNWNPPSLRPSWRYLGGATTAFLSTLDLETPTQSIVYFLDLIG